MDSGEPIKSKLKFHKETGIAASGNLERVVSYDFDIQSLVSVDAPYGTDPDTLIEQVFIKLIQRARHQEIELVCENIFDPETGYYEDIPAEWYKNP